MAELNPAPWLQNSGETNSAQLLRLGATGLAAGQTAGVTARGGVHPSVGSALIVSAGAGLSVNIGAGVVYVPGTSDNNQGLYVCTNTSTVNLALQAADGSNPRIDLIVARVVDTFYVGGTPGTDDLWELVVVTGTPSGSPAIPTPGFDTFEALATVSVPAGASTPGTITDIRQFVTGVGGIMPIRNSSERPTIGRYESMRVHQFDDNTDYNWDGGDWVPFASALIGSGAAVTLGTFDGGAGTNVTTIFSGIDQSFAHLLLLWRGRNDASNVIVTCSMRFNGDGGSNYHSEQARTAGTSWSHNANSNTTSIRVGYVGSQSATHGKILIPEYSNFAGATTKGAHGESHARGVDGSATNNSWGCGAGYWTGTDAITSIQLWPASQLWGINVRATLIGIRA